MSGTVERQAPRLIEVRTEREALLVTPEHPFATVDSGWVAAGSLSAGDFVVSAWSGVVRVAAVREEALPRPVTVFNLSVENTHAYLVGAHGVLVHNTGCSGDDKQANQLKRIAELRSQIAGKLAAERAARATREQLVAAGKDTSEIDRHIASLEQQRIALLDRLALARVRQLRAGELTDTGWMNGTRQGLERARLAELRQELTRGRLSRQELRERAGELARSEPITPEYLAAIWRALETVSRYENLSSLRQELLKQFDEFEARDAQLRDEYGRAEGARRHELAEQRARLRAEWQSATRLPLERARQELEAARAAPKPRNERFEAELEQTIAFLEKELQKDLRLDPQGVAKREELAEIRRKLRSERGRFRGRLQYALRTRERLRAAGKDTRKVDARIEKIKKDHSNLIREGTRLEEELHLMDPYLASSALLDETQDLDVVVSERDELMEREPSPERAAGLESNYERLQQELREQRAALEVALSALANEAANIHRTQAGSSRGPTWQERVSAIQEEQGQLRAEWRAGLQERLDSLRRQLGVRRNVFALRDPAIVTELAREIALLERELQHSG